MTAAALGEEVSRPFEQELKLRGKRIPHRLKPVRNDESQWRELMVTNDKSEFTTRISEVVWLVRAGSRLDASDKRGNPCCFSLPA